MKWLKRAFRDTWPYRMYYGNRRSDIKPCIRVKNPKDKCNNIIHYKYGIAGGTLTCYQVSYLINYKRIPNGNISHDCGNVYNTKNTSCIEPTHMQIANQNENMGRRSCHSKIRKWEKSNRKRVTFSIIGAWHLTDIRTEENNLIQKGLKPTPRIKQKSGQEDDYYYCYCDDPECFINYHKYKTKYFPKKKAKKVTR